MLNYIGMPLKIVLAYLENNNINYSITFNSQCDEQQQKNWFVTNVKEGKEKVEIIVSNFKIEV